MPPISESLITTCEIPTAWVNLAPIVGHFPRPQSSRGEPATVDGLSRLYTDECARIEMLDGEYQSHLEVDIPGGVLDEYAKYRPTPLCRARALERHLDFRGRILYKREDLNPTGSHKPNTAIPQAFYAKREGVKHLVTDTGAGQWGTSLAWACWNAGLSCTVFMTRNSFRGKPYRRVLMELSGACVHASPSSVTRQGRELLQSDPDHAGSLGIGMGEAVELASQTPHARLALGCMSYYAALHQTIVGRELQQQLERAGERADVLVACVGGGTNLFGFAAPFFERKLRGAAAPRIVAAESVAVPALTTGEYRYDYADAFGLTPQVLMYTLGHEFLPPPMHSGGLRYHGKSPILSLMKRLGHLEAVAIAQEKALQACRLFFQVEGVLCAPETGHAIAAVLDIVRRAQASGDTPTIVFCLSGTGYLDLQAHEPDGHQPGPMRK